MELIKLWITQIFFGILFMFITGLCKASEFAVGYFTCWGCWIGYDIYENFIKKK